MPRGFTHYFGYGYNERSWNVFVKQIAHRIHKDHFCLRPSKRIEKALWHQTKVEPLLVWMARHTPKTLCERLRVAVSTARANLCTPPDRVPGRVGPFDMRDFCHGV